MQILQQKIEPHTFDQKTAALVQEQFQCLDDVIYLNTALASVLPACVEKAYADEQRHFQESYASEENWDEERQQAREGIARLIHAKPENIALLSNTVEGIGLMARDYPWQNEKNIVTYSGEHSSNLLPWMIGERKGRFRLKMVEVRGGCLSTADVLRTIDDETQALAFSVVQYSDGARIDLTAIGRECHKRGILFILDGIQAVGRLHIDVAEAEIDFLSCSAHKGLLVRNGISFVYCAREVLDQLTPSVAAMHSIKDSLQGCARDPKKPIPWHDDARKLENGNRNHPGVCGLIAATSFLNSIGTRAIEGHVIALQQELYAQLGQDAGKVRPFSEMLSGILRVDFPPEKAAGVEYLLRENKIYATVRRDNVRFCIGIFNTMDHMRVLATVIREILAMREDKK